jgi:hypothetical protein
MTIPGFTAESSLLKSRELHASSLQFDKEDGRSVIPQQFFCAPNGPCTKLPGSPIGTQPWICCLPWPNCFPFGPLPCV